MFPWYNKSVLVVDRFSIFPLCPGGLPAPGAFLMLPEPPGSKTGPAETPRRPAPGTARRAPRTGTATVFSIASTRLYHLPLQQVGNLTGQVNVFFCVPHTLCKDPIREQILVSFTDIRGTSAIWPHKSARTPVIAVASQHAHPAFCDWDPILVRPERQKSIIF